MTERWWARWAIPVRERSQPDGDTPEASGGSGQPEEGSVDEGLVDTSTQEPDSDDVEEVAVHVARSARETEFLVEREATGRSDHPDVNHPGPPINRRSPLYLGFYAVLGGLLAYGLVHLVLDLSQLLTLVGLALFLALGLEPIVAKLVRMGLGRGLAVLFVVIGLCAILTLLGWLILPTVVDQTTQLVENAPDSLLRLQHNHLVEQLNSRWHVTNRVRQDVQSFIEHVTFSSVFGGILGAGRAIVNGVLATFTVLILTLYFLVAMPRVKMAVYQMVPSSRRPRVVYLSEEITRRVGSYFLGQLCVASINGGLSYVILRILGLPFAAVLAVLVGMLALVPVLGTLIGGVLVTLVALESGWVDAVIVLGYYVAYHLVEAYVLAPKIMRRAVEVPPVVTIMAILAGQTLLGILGALLAIPVAAGLLLIYEEVLVPRQQQN